MVFLPSLGRPGSDLDVMADAATTVGCSAIVVDLHGVGDSGPLPPGSDLHTMASDVADLVSGSEPVVVVGHAFGNRVARCLAADRPDLVAGLMLLGCGGRVPGDPEARAALRRCFDQSLDADDHLEAVATAFFAHGGDPSVWAGGWWPEAAEGQSAASAATPVEEWWVPPTPVPVLAVVGRDDRISPSANAISLLGALGPGARLEIISGAGHALVPEQPDRVVAALLGFLSDVGHTAPGGE